MMWVLVLFLGCGLRTADPVYTGTIEVTEVDIAALVPGRLVLVAAGDGDRVTKGQLLFRLDTAQLEGQVALREGQVAQARAAIDAAAAQVRAVRAQVLYLDRELRRVEALEADGVATEQQASTLQGQRDVARAQVSVASQGVAQAEAAEAQAQAGLQIARDQLSEGSVLSPTDGVVLHRNREPGEIVAAGMSVLTVGDLSRPRLRVYLPLTRIEQLSLGDPVRVRLDSDPSVELQGEVRWISSQAEFTPRDILTPEERVKRVFAVDVAVQAGVGLHPGVPAEALFGEG